MYSDWLIRGPPNKGARVATILSHYANMQPICLSNLNFFRILFFQTVKALSMVMMSVLEHLPRQSHTGCGMHNILWYQWPCECHTYLLCSTRTTPSTIVYSAGLNKVKPDANTNCTGECHFIHASGSLVLKSLHGTLTNILRQYYPGT